MPPENSHLPPLPKEHRHSVFLLMVFLFVVAVPAMVFYAVGYRYDFLSENNPIVAVGGLYISSQIDDGNIYVNDELVDDFRIFRSAAYIQNLDEGVHEVYVEREGVHTWVKELPVFAHLVTEAQSFNLPVRSQIRLLSEWNNDAGIGVLFEPATTTLFAFASTTNLLELASSTVSTSTLNPNLEHDYIASRFASSSEEAAILEQYEIYQAQRFGFANQEPAAPTTTATTSREYQDMKLYQVDGEVYAAWIGEPDEVPFYFCLTNKGSLLTAQLYGSHAYRQLIAQTPSTTDLLVQDMLDQRVCRANIHIDRLRQTVHWFDFMPDNEHLVLMLLDDGLYVVEIDDRAWQNTQQLYPGENLEVLIDGGRIFVKDRGYYLEVFTEIPE